MKSPTLLRRIGFGNCGSVWAPEDTNGDTAHAIKREDGGRGRSLYNEYIMHIRTLESASANNWSVQIPNCHQYVPQDDSTWWKEHISQFPKEEVESATNALISDRIAPFSKGVRDTLIKLYCPASLRPSIEKSRQDQDCLIRPYLGRRRQLAKQSRFKCFKLRNYPLHMDQIEELSLDGALYARIMAETLAELYWRAHIDASDIEFVLAPTTSKGIQSQALGDHQVGILDFDCCKIMPMDEKGVAQAVRAFFMNDPCFPRPGRTDGRDQLLWTEFKNRFLEKSKEILGKDGNGAGLPNLWVDSVEQWELLNSHASLGSRSLVSIAS